MKFQNLSQLTDQNPITECETKCPWRRTNLSSICSQRFLCQLWDLTLKWKKKKYCSQNVWMLLDLLSKLIRITRYSKNYHVSCLGGTCGVQVTNKILAHVHFILDAPYSYLLAPPCTIVMHTPSTWQNSHMRILICGGKVIKVMFKWKLLKLLYPLVKVVSPKKEHILCRINRD